MAIIRFGTTVIGIRGTIAGVTFSAGPSGPYAKTWRRPKNQTSAIAADTKRNITPYGALWSSMSTTLQNSWKSFAAAPPELDYNPLGIQYWLTGYQWLVRANVRRAALGLGPTTTVPLSLAVTAPATATLTAVAGDPANVDVGWTSGDFPTTFAAFGYFAIYPSTGLLSFPGKGLLAWAAYMPSGTSADVSTLINSRFGTLPVGYTLFLNLHRFRTDGVRSSATPAVAPVT